MTQETRKDIVAPSAALKICKEIINNDAFRDYLGKLLPPEANLTIDRFCNVVGTYLKNEPTMQTIPYDILKNCIAQAARYGVLPGGSEPGCYFATFGNGRPIEMHLSYMGIRDIVYRTGLVKDILAAKVLDGDEFSCDPTILERPIMHKISLERDPKKIKGYYICLINKDGTQKAEFCNYKEADELKTKRVKPGGKPTAWTTNPEGMIFKTLIKRALKHMCKVDQSSSIQILKDALQDDGFEETSAVTVVDAVKDGNFADVLAFIDDTPKDGNKLTPSVSDKKAFLKPGEQVDVIPTHVDITDPNNHKFITDETFSLNPDDPRKIIPVEDYTFDLNAPPFTFGGNPTLTIDLNAPPIKLNVPANLEEPNEPMIEDTLGD